MFQVDLIEKCKQNHRPSQLKLYEQYCDGMLIVASRFMNDVMEAEDMVQEAFIKAFTKLDQFQGDVTFGAWLKRIVINKCIDEIKSKKERLVELEDVHMAVVEADQGQSWLIEDGIGIDQVKAAIATLPDKYSIVLKLFLMEGYDHQEIAEILGISEMASRTQLSRGKQKLKELLKQKHHGTRS